MSLFSVNTREKRKTGRLTIDYKSYIVGSVEMFTLPSSDIHCNGKKIIEKCKLNVTKKKINVTKIRPSAY